MYDPEVFIQRLPVKVNLYGTSLVYGTWLAYVRPDHPERGIFGLNNLFKNDDSIVLCSTQSCTYIFATMFLIETFLKIASLLR